VACQSPCRTAKNAGADPGIPVQAESLRRRRNLTPVSLYQPQVDWIPAFAGMAMMRWEGEQAKGAE